MLERFHIFQKLSIAIGNIRATEIKVLIKQGKEVILRNVRRTLLKNPENLTNNQKFKLKELLKGLSSFDEVIDKASNNKMQDRLIK